MGTSVLHFGPAHPAAHGVLRCMLCMRSEYVVGCTLTLGLLHRGTERLMEMRHPVTSCKSNVRHHTMLIVVDVEHMVLVGMSMV